ncbi:hypothetical protein PtA15_10A297 [Puccinia triticina]|uniref:Uncharacterized protein n=1 Tax=Puccinia triticina TaxID=208348 RepID=A0ABY7CUF5_9BASI|nr:uncharacterized protein PtA15_10A297 [Puccinia triticina]WAQ88876.1 hypothetical protein PtA15_10A297 [Puccinia triticina]
MSSASSRRGSIFMTTLLNSLANSIKIEDDINKGFFDYVKFPPEFGVLNNLAPAPSSSTPTSTSGAAPPQPAPSALPDPQGKQPVRARGLNLQTFLRSKLQARTLMAERTKRISPHLKIKMTSVLRMA